MKKLILIIIVAVVLVTGILLNSQSTPQMAETVKDETVRGDIVELQGKSMFYRDKYGDYPVFMDNVYEMPESDVVWGVQVLEEFYTKSKGAGAKAYIEENVKLIDLATMKSKGITYDLANKKSKYYLDLVTGNVLSPDLIERGDEDYLGGLSESDGMYGPLAKNPIKIKDTSTGVEMQKVQGSIRSGSNIYFYGGGDMVLAIRNELTNEIRNAGEELQTTEGITEILYIQQTTGKAAVIVGGEVKVMGIELGR